jgi:hypothetical protein
VKNNRESSLAEKISKLVESESRSSDVAALFAAIERVERRLDRLETETLNAEKNRTDLPLHPSLDRFAIAEAIADVVFDGQPKEKTCTFEPNGRSCDHCAMCSSRGF